jgi:hypothetical protein
LARAGVALLGARAIGSLGAPPRLHLANVAGITASGRMAALPATALVFGAANFVVAIRGAAAGAAGRRLAVGARAAVLARATQRGVAALAVLARADGARVIVGIAL